MSRHKSDCDTYNKEYGPEPEEEDFFKEVVQNSLRAKKEGYFREKSTKKK